MILARLSQSPIDNEPKNINEILKKIENYAKDGLRTLVLAYKEIEETKYQV